MEFKATNPAEDLLALFTKPKEFFTSLREPSQIDFWVFTKAVGGAMTIFALLQWSHFPEDLSFSLSVFQSLFQQLMQQASQGGAALYLHGRDAEQIYKGIESFFSIWMGLSVFQALLAPIFKVVSLSLLAFFVMLMLPLVGVSAKRATYFHIMVVLAYAQWVNVLFFLPLLPWLVQVFLALLVPVLVLRHVFEISFVRAYVAFLFLPIAILASSALGVFFLLGMSLAL